VIEDTLQMDGEHAIELFFHCHEDCVVEATARGFVVKRGERAIELELPSRPGCATHVLEASEQPIGGWVSRRFDRKVRAPTILWSAVLAGRQVLRTAIRC
jgi:hypothetical protein